MSEAERVRAELRSHGFVVCRQLLPAASVERARQHLEKAVDKHLEKAVTQGAVPDACAELPLEERIAAAYAAAPDSAPVSWVAETRTSLAFQGMLFRDSSLCALIEGLTSRPPVVAARYNVRSKLPGSSGANFPWHQDHAFFRMQYLLKKQPAKRLIAAWAPLVPVSQANGAVEIAVGSHAHGLAKHRRNGAFLATEAEPQSAFERVVPTLLPGDVLLFTDLTMHRSGRNGLPTVRWSADWAYELEPSDDVCPALESQPEAAARPSSHDQASGACEPSRIALNGRSRLPLGLCVALLAASLVQLASSRLRAGGR